MVRKKDKATKKYENKNLKGELKRRKVVKDVAEREESKAIRRAIRLAKEESRSKAKARGAAELGVKGKKKKNKRQRPKISALPEDEESDEADEMLAMAVEAGDAVAGKAGKSARGSKKDKYAGLDFEGFMQKMQDSDDDDDGAAEASSDGDDDEGESSEGEGVTEADLVAKFGVDGFSSSDDGSASDDASNNVASSAKNARAKVVDEHKMQMDQLAEQDPEFFKFLQEHDAGLLDFAAESDDGEEEEVAAEAELLREAAAEEKRNRKKDMPLSKLPVISAEMYSQWKKLLVTKELTPRRIRTFVAAFKSAVAMTVDASGQAASTRSERDENEAAVTKALGKIRFRVESEAVFNMIVLFSLRNMHKIFNAYLQIQSQRARSRGSQRKPYTPGPRAVPSKVPGFVGIKRTVQSYLRTLIVFVDGVRDPSILRLVFVHLDALIPFMQHQLKTAKRLLKTLVAHWARAESEDTMLHAFLTIRTMALNLPAWFINDALKRSYMAFVREVKHTAAHTAARQQLLRNCLVELFGINVEASYQHAFVYIRQLAILLRTAISAQSKSSLATVYNWQVVHSLRLWAQILAQYKDSDKLEPLRYPVIQILSGIATLAPSARYFPLHLHVMEDLVNLAAATGLVTPAATALLSILHAESLAKKSAASTTKPIDLTIVVKVTKSYTTSRAFKTSVVDRVAFILLRHAHSLAGTIAFPELLAPVLSSVRTFSRNKAIAPALRKRVAYLISAIGNHSRWIRAKRDSITFAPGDTAAVEAFEAGLNTAKSPIQKAYVAKLKEHEAERARLADDAAAAATFGNDDDKLDPAEHNTLRQALEAATDPRADDEDDHAGSAKRKRSQPHSDESSNSSDDDESSSDDDEPEEAPSRKRRKTIALSAEQERAAHRVMSIKDESELPADTVQELGSDDDW
ncbi:uncharacterized protein AMSG_02854 [Thecamonas trahens ATCC 50062]|uniref:Nucleolar complex protein 2 n=1 Tax=Thecamonas trahens ATCC 50062 TaxID=461836 RepID=A0A0L0D2K7_THETB|nr:hypothetical protein AMSG_02854 [Thecamonas trahens ATCC 50062]KNC46400.1 hypothetical protein AMSG_02854 [Thecamonas trahens ATCC 50062]|eukprot:XP_013760693.1 hypothetical protein AMSG_02854 [Thecamonas trahens ATCC 50062]